MAGGAAPAVGVGRAGRCGTVGRSGGRRAGEAELLGDPQGRQRDGGGEHHGGGARPGSAADGPAPGHPAADPRQRGAVRLEVGDGAAQQLPYGPLLGRQRLRRARPAPAVRARRTRARPPRPVLLGHCPASIRTRSAAIPRDPYAFTEPSEMPRVSATCASVMST